MSDEEQHKYKKVGAALVNHDDMNYQKYINQRARLRAAKEENSELRQKMTALENDVSMMKNLLLELVNRK
jgi:hypothetical protein